MYARSTPRFGLSLAYFLVLPVLGLACGEEALVVPGPGGDAGAGTGVETPENGGSGAGGNSAEGGSGGSVDGPSGGTGGSGGGTTGGSSGEPGVTTPVNPPGTTGPIGVVIPDDEAQGWVFDETEVHSYELTLDPAVWAALQANARDEQYAEADLSAAGQVVARVGLRFKGSLGTLASCVADDGSLTCSKLSMKLKFDEYVPEQRFFGLKRLVFNSMAFDDSLLHERLAYRVYREMGVIAPRSVHARLIINGEDWGVFSLVEDVDGRFTKNHFAEGDGNLYKEAWPSNFDQDILADALETNEEVADHTVLVNFQAELLAAAPEDLPFVVANYLDLDNTFAYLAVDDAIHNWDGIAAFYCVEGYCENHNFYWYQDQVEPRFALIPWDLDNTFETSSPLDEIPGLLELPADCSVRYPAFEKTLMAPACDPLLGGLARIDRSRYLAQVNRLLDGPFAPGEIESWIDAWYAQLAPQVATDTRGPTPADFEAAVDRLYDAVESLRERTQALQ
jgi:spore coat protein H